MGKLLNGILIGFGSALSIITFASWHILLLSVSQRFLIIGEADFMQAVEITANLTTIMGILCVITGLSMELHQRWKQRSKADYEYPA